MFQSQPSQGYSKALVATSLSKKFSLRHVFRVGAIVWCKYRGQDYYVVIKSFTRPNRGTQIPGGL